MARIEEFLVANMPSHLHNDVSRAGAGALERLKCSTTRSTGELRIVQVCDSVWIAATTSIPEGQKVFWVHCLAATPCTSTTGLEPGCNLAWIPRPLQSAATSTAPPQCHTASC